MRRPLDGREVNAFFVHVPQGAQIAQFGDVEANGLNGVVDFFFGRKTTDRHAQTAMG